MSSRLTRAAAAVAALLLALAMLTACGDDGSDSAAGGPGEGVSVTIADKGFAESAIVARMYAVALEEQGFDVEVTSLGSTEIADQAIRDGEIDIYPEYTGTSFLNVLGRDATSAPDDPTAVYEEVEAAYVDRGLTTLPPAPYNNGNEVACTQAAVDQYDIQTLSDLGEVSDQIVYSANAEHLTRDDGLPLLQSEYGIDFKDVKTVDISLRYQPIEEGTAQCVYAFGTDPALGDPDLNLVVLEDDKGIFSAGVPFMNFPVINTAFYEGLTEPQRTALTEAINGVNQQLTAEAIRPLIARVEFDREDPEAVAADFLAGGGEEAQ